MIKIGDKFKDGNLFLQVAYVNGSTIVLYVTLACGSIINGRTVHVSKLDGLEKV